MSNGSTLPLEMLLAVFFILLVIMRRGGAWFLVGALFVIVSVALRLSIEIDGVRDFYPYYDSFIDVKYGDVPPNLLIEPYRLALFRFVLAFGDAESISQIHAVYYIHFFFVTLFFLWLAWLRDVSFEAKLFLFLAFYPALAFVWIRAGMAYMMSCYLLYTFTTGRTRWLQVLLPAIHISTIPILIAVWIKDFSVFWKATAVAALVTLALVLLGTNYANYVLYKWEAYTLTGDERTSSNLFVLHIFNIAVFAYFAAINVSFRWNSIIILMMASYLVLFWFNPVIGLRIFPFVLIACITQRIYFARYKGLTLGIILVLCPVFLYRFEQIML